MNGTVQVWSEARRAWVPADPAAPILHPGFWLGGAAMRQDASDKAMQLGDAVEQRRHHDAAIQLRALAGRAA